MDMSVKLCSITLDNPVIAASGCFGYGAEMAQFYDINILGSFSFKGTTKEARLGNDCPRIAECSGGMLNAVGLQNPGIDKVLREELPALRKVFTKPVIANIGGFSEDEYVYCCQKAEECENVDMIELNISCPNVHNGSMSFGTDTQSTYSVVSKVRKALKKPLAVKLTPNITDITETARAAQDAGADALTLINTLLGMRFDLRRRMPLLANTTGGLSGPAVFPVALAAVYRTAQCVSIPIIGCGGVASAEDVIEMMMAGAAAVQIGAMNLVDPYICKTIIESLPACAEKYGFKSISEITGCALPEHK
ncbi:MAG TPA: dihydroorotate dehydrogenase [Bacillota bacterium]|nr:dihydroorotate dehydrogenase [Bacillota bacterium]